jgi:hypothetical protein
MKEYEKPTMEVITLLGNVITASCPLDTDCPEQGPGSCSFYGCSDDE